MSQIAQNQIYPPGAFKILESIENTPSIALELLDLGVGTLCHHNLVKIISPGRCNSYNSMNLGEF